MLKGCGNVYSTSERNHQTFNKIWAKSNFGRHVDGGKSMPSNMAANTNQKALNSRKVQRTNQKYRNLVGSDQQI